MNYFTRVSAMYKKVKLGFSKDSRGFILNDKGRSIVSIFETDHEEFTVHMNSGPSYTINRNVLYKTINIWETYAKNQGFKTIHFWIIGPKRKMDATNYRLNEFVNFFEHLDYSIEEGPGIFVKATKKLKGNEITFTDLSLIATEFFEKLLNEKKDVNVNYYNEDEKLFIDIITPFYSETICLYQNIIESSEQEFILDDISKITFQLEAIVDQFFRTHRMNAVFETPNHCFESVMLFYSIPTNVASEVFRKLTNVYEWLEIEKYCANLMKTNTISVPESVPYGKDVKKLTILNHDVYYWVETNKEKTQFTFITKIIDHREEVNLKEILLEEKTENRRTCDK